jgi:hypothetical protein
MSMIRPEITQKLLQSREVIAAAALGAFGLWLVWLGGYVLFPAGLLILAAAAGWALTALRRIRFAQSVLAPGVVEVDEGQIGYLGPSFGGYVAIPDLTELRLVTMYGRRMWRLKQTDGQAVLIPVDATGSDRLFDTFASLPGMDMRALMAAIDAPASTAQGTALTVVQPDAPLTADMRLIWRRQVALAQGS